MGGRIGLDAHSAISWKSKTRAVGDGGTANLQAPVLVMTSASGAAPHLQVSATQHAGLTLVPESSDAEAELPTEGNTLVPDDGCNWERHSALIPCAALRGIMANAGDFNAISSCQSGRVANTVPRRKRRLTSPYSGPQTQGHATATEFRGR